MSLPRRGPLALRWLLAGWLVLASAGSGAEEAVAPPLPPVRFVLSFDDGPSGEPDDNPTETILDALADNPTQQNIKAIFFVQTRIEGGGASDKGRALLAREQREGHVLALHSGTELGHRSHRGLDDAALAQSLRDGGADLAAVTGRAASLVRPPYWAYDERTLTAYAQHGLEMLLTDITANDGKTWGFKASPRRYIHMAGEMRKLLAKLRNGEFPLVEGVAPVVVTFHDTNSYTAEHMREYIAMLVDEARAQGLALAPRPFYDEASALERAALMRARDVAHRTDMTPWWWRWLQW